MKEVPVHNSSFEICSAVALQKNMVNFVLSLEL